MKYFIVVIIGFACILSGLIVVASIKWFMEVYKERSIYSDTYCVGLVLILCVSTILTVCGISQIYSMLM